MNLRFCAIFCALLPQLAPAAAPETAESSCDSVARCNAIGTAAYQAGRYTAAATAFDRQIDYAETAIERVENENLPAGDSLAHDREIALNNAALARIGAGECLQARTLLKLADPGHRATRANTALLERRCATGLRADSRTGDYWQYARHSFFSTLTLHPGKPGELLLDAYWVRTGRGPMDEYGPAAVGSLEQLSLDLDGDVASGLYNGLEDDQLCELKLHFVGQAVEIDYQKESGCNTGGFGAVLGGRYELVSTTPSSPWTSTP